MDRLLRHEVVAGGTPSRTVHFRATSEWLAIRRPRGRIGCLGCAAAGRCTVPARGTASLPQQCAHVSAPGFALAWRQVSAGEQQFESHVRITVRSGLSAGHAPCLILARLGISGSPLPYLSAWNNEPTASLLPMLTWQSTLPSR